MAEHSPIISTKVLVPRRRPELLRRPRLVDFLHEHLDHKLIVVAAPAGYGKTSLLVDFTHDTDIPICWYTLDRFDADPRVFLEHLIAAIQRQFPDFGSRSQAALANSGDVGRSLYPLAAVLANEIYEIPEYFAVVLDDYHRVDHSDVINDFFSILLSYVEENCHVILASRTVPGIPDQALMVARRQMIGLSAEELRFTPHEIQALVQQNCDLAMPYDRAEELARFSDGWITGIVLAGHQATWEKLVEGVASAPEARDWVYEYLAEQVFGQQPEDLRHFLLGSSVLDRMSPRLCDEILGLDTSAAYLERIERRNLFLNRLSGEEMWYVYHPLFREFLLQHLERTDHERYETLHLRLAGLHEAREEWDEAVEGYLKLGHYEEAARVLERAETPLYVSGRWDTLTRWLDSLPHQLLETRPRLMSLRGKLHVDSGEILLALELYQRALPLFQAAGDLTQVARTRLRKAITLRYQRRYRQSIQDGREVLSILAGLEDGTEKRLWKAAVWDSEGLCYYFLGRLAEAIERFEKAVSLFEQVKDAFGTANAYHNLGISCRALGRIAEAMGHYQSALRYWQRAGNPGSVANTLNSLGVICHLQGDWEDASRLYAEALDRAREAGLAQVHALVLTSLGDLLRDKGDHREALSSYREGLELSERAGDAFLIIYIKSAVGDTHRLMGQFEKAGALITAALAQAEKSGSDYSLAICLIALGILRYEQGRSNEALDHLAAAVKLLEKAGIKHELARGHLHLAQALFLQREKQAALDHLVVVGELVDELGYDHFLVVEGRRMGLLFQQAASVGLGGDRFARLLERMAQVAPGAQQQPVVAVSAGPALDIRAFGQARILRGEDELAVRRGVVKELFFYLLALHPTPVRDEEVMEVLWTDVSAAKAHGALRTALYRIRRTICPVATEGGWVTLELPDHRYDIAEFERLIAAARGYDGNPEQQMACYRQALALYLAPYLEGWDSLWCLNERQWLQREYINALVGLAEAFLELQSYAASVEHYQQAVEAEPYREDVWRGLLRAQALAGDRAAAVESYGQMMRLLREDLGLDPAPETEALYRDILDMRL